MDFVQDARRCHSGKLPFGWMEDSRVPISNIRRKLLERRFEDNTLGVTMTLGDDLSCGSGGESFWLVPVPQAASIGEVAAIG